MICSLKFKKDVVILKMLLWILCFWFWSYALCKLSNYPHLTSSIDKTRHGPVIALFFCGTSSAFLATSEVCLQPIIIYSYWLIGIFWLSASYNTQGAFAILFLICRDLLNCLRSRGTMVITTQSGWNSLKVIFTEQFLTKVAIFRCFDVYSVLPPQIFQAQAKISKVRPVFPDYLSVSYGFINRLSTSVFVPVNEIVLNGSNGLMIKCLIVCLMN